MRFFIVLLLSLAIAGSASAQQNLQPGVDAPDFAAQTLNGTQLNLSSLQGKVVVLTFWSTKCAICHSEIPRLNQMVERFRSRDVVFLALTTENEARLEPFLRKNPFRFDILPNSFGILLKYADMDRAGNINIGFPAHYLINRRGKIQLRTSGWDKAEKLEGQINRLLASE
jgi:peroxiredoxin